MKIIRNNKHFFSLNKKNDTHTASTSHRNNLLKTIQYIDSLTITINTRNQNSDIFFSKQTGKNHRIFVLLQKQEA